MDNLHHHTIATRFIGLELEEMGGEFSVPWRSEGVSYLLDLARI